ncbi:hypothetical protein EIB72_31030 [Burkholderia ambifaria]|uniref:hypothetical protein n=1 Tax=Burkholderia ambifaria TaxID=152480 RepID=UPI0013FDA763|nr:hypothetical protein [Burkholderia ambifaria]NHL70813.1 hypothetical protein [Burkholderia ambifaria]
MSDLFFSTNLLGEFDRLHRQMASVLAGFPARPRAMRYELFSPHRPRRRQRRDHRDRWRRSAGSDRWIA